MACSTGRDLPHAVEHQSARRVVLDGVLSRQDCTNLICALRCLGVRGYRPGVCSATCFEVEAAAPEVLVPLMAARERVREAVEEALGLPLGLIVEFTGLISWRPGAAIGFHHDANRDYLQQRAYAAVCYLNAAGTDFRGGAFCFRSGEPQQVAPMPGRVVAYHAQEEHAVQPVTAGERFTLTLWFTLDPEHSEDTKLLRTLAGSPSAAGCSLPESMYQLEDNTDLRLCRLAMMGFGLQTSAGYLLRSAPGLATHSSAAPLQLVLHAAAYLRWHAASATPQLQHQQGGACKGSIPQMQVLATGIHFSSVLQAAQFVHAWTRHYCPLSRLSQELVCCRHLCVSDQAGPSCCWLDTTATMATETAADSVTRLADVMQSLAAAAQQHEQQAAEQKARFEQMRESWLHVGAVFES